VRLFVVGLVGANGEAKVRRLSCRSLKVWASVKAGRFGVPVWGQWINRPRLARNFGTLVLVVRAPAEHF